MVGRLFRGDDCWGVIDDGAWILRGDGWEGDYG